MREVEKPAYHLTSSLQHVQMIYGTISRLGIPMAPSRYEPTRAPYNSVQDGLQIAGASKDAALTTRYGNEVMVSKLSKSKFQDHEMYSHLAHAAF